MLDVHQFTKYIIRPALEAIGLYSKAAEELVLGTAIQESRLRYLAQLGSGLALSLYQMEPATHDSIWVDFLPDRPKLALKVKRLAIPLQAESAFEKMIHDVILKTSQIPVETLLSNRLYAAAMCRVRYYWVPAALPAAGDVSRQAAYWKRYYNTAAGAGTEQEYLDNWYKYSGWKVMV